MGPLELDGRPLGKNCRWTLLTQLTDRFFSFYFSFSYLGNPPLLQVKTSSAFFGLLFLLMLKMKENNEKKGKNEDEISKLIKAFPKDIAALDKRSVLAKVNSQGSGT